ncbi:hypothetical protein [Aestuariimicrobium kwangyangense]|uniref:hypothetical protein n=1 Tax=Aestuariimicrobium kwangyangense TaxID=396389 RepID=UPI0012FB966B|nr:hypothetical protein [Aestuariimicrobium kwangyangense]
MVGTLLRLQLKLSWRAVRRNVGILIALAIGGLYALGFVLAAVAGLTLLRGQPLSLAGVVTTLGFALVTVGWPMVTLLVAGMDQTLDPGRFALFPVRARQLMPGLLAVSQIGVGGLITLALAAGQVVTWSRAPGPLVFSVLALLVGVPTCVLLARTLASFFSAAFNRRRWRDVAALILGLFGLGVGVAIQLLQRTIMDHRHELASTLQPAATLLGWTPLAWAWSMPWEAAHGLWWVAAVKLVLSVAFVVVLWKVWERQLDLALVSPLLTGGDGTKVRPHSRLDRLFPDSPAGAVAARSLRYWRRDPRHLMVLVSVFAVPFLMAFPMLINPELGGVHRVSTTLYPIGGMVMMAGLTVSTEIVYDGSALWMHVTSGLRGMDDRWGRVLAVLCILGPIALVSATAFLALSGQWAWAPAVYGGMIGAVGAGMGVGSLAGAVWQYAAPPPGQNAFGRTSGGGMVGLFLTLVCMVGTLIISLPFIGPLLVSLDRPSLVWLVAVIGALLGPVYTWLGVVFGGMVLDRTWPEVLKRVTYQG